jgi:ATP-dependent exoDNAse (exonuclease V) alpha subunit
MIAKGAQRGDGGQLAAYLVSVGENERVEVGAIFGVPAAGRSPRARVAAAVAAMEASLAGSRATQRVIHAHISPSEALSPGQWRRAWEIYEEAQGIRGHAYAEVWHVKAGPTGARVPHCHRAYSRCLENGRAVALPHSRKRNELASRWMEFEFGHPYTAGKHDLWAAAQARRIGRPEVADWIEARRAALGLTAADRAEAVVTEAERRQQQRTEAGGPQAGPRAFRRAVLEAWRAADCGKAFQAALVEQGFELVRGGRADFMIVDRAGEAHELARTLAAAGKAEGRPVRRAELRAEIAAKAGDLDYEALEPVGEARRTARQTAREGLAGGSGPADPLAGLYSRRAVFSEGDLRTACRAAAGGEAGLADRLYQSQLAGEALITLSVDAGRRQFTTRATVQAEAELLRLAGDGAGSFRHAVPAWPLARQLDRFCSEKSFTLKAEQIAAVKQVCGGGDVAAVTGVAGAGKSTMLEAAASVYRQQGYRVEGAALTGTAARNLSEIGIPSQTLHRWIRRFDRQEGYRVLLRTGWLDAATSEDGSRTVRSELLEALERWQRKSGTVPGWVAAARDPLARVQRLETLPEPVQDWVRRFAGRRLADAVDAQSVLMIDEAGMVGHRQMAGVLSRARRAGAKVILVGDAEQLQPIEAGAAYRVIVERIGAADMTEVMRQREDWQRQATQGLASGTPERAAAALRAYAAHGKVRAGVGGFDPEDPAVIAEAETRLGRTLAPAEAERLTTLARYAAARTEAGSLWSEIAAAQGKPEQHPLYGAYLSQRGQRDDSARRIGRELEGFRPWLARYGIDGEGLAADLLAAGGCRRSLAEQRAAAEAGRLGIADLKTEGPRLSFDWRAAARAELVKAWSQSVDTYPEQSQIIIAYTNRDVQALNAAARAHYRATGRLAGDGMTLTRDDGEVIPVAIGDRLVALKNAGTLTNGSFGTVTGIKASEGSAPLLRLRLDSGSETVVDTAVYRDLAHGYAATIHKLQGATVDRSFVLAHSGMDRHLWYVALSRHREDVQVFAASADAATPEALALAARKANSAETVSEVLDLKTARAGGVERAAARLAAAEAACAAISNKKERLTDGASRRAALRAAAAGAAGADAAARPQPDGLSDLPVLPVVAARRGSGVLLPADARPDVAGAGAGSDRDRLRRAEPRIAPPCAEPERREAAPPPDRPALDPTIERFMAEARRMGVDPSWIHKLAAGGSLRASTSATAAPRVSVPPPRDPLAEYRGADEAFRAAERARLAGNPQAIEAAAQAHDRLVTAAHAVRADPSSSARVSYAERSAIAVTIDADQRQKAQAQRDAEMVRTLRRHYPAPAGAEPDPLARYQAAQARVIAAMRAGDPPGQQAARQQLTEAAVTIVGDRQQLAQARAAGIEGQVRMTFEAACRQHTPVAAAVAKPTLGA